jgi:hypothetical protein
MTWGLQLTLAKPAAIAEALLAGEGVFEPTALSAGG